MPTKPFMFVHGEVLQTQKAHRLAANPVISSIGRILGADQIAIYLIDCDDAVVKPVPGWGGHGPFTVAYREFLIDVASAGQDNDRYHAWLSDNGSTQLAVRLKDQSGYSVVLAATFLDNTTSGRVQILSLISEVVTLIEHHSRVSNQLRALKIEHAGTVAALDHDECGIIVVGAEGQKLFANAAAERFLAEGDGLRVRHGRVQPTGRIEMQRFREALNDIADAVNFSMPDSDRVKSHAVAMLLPRDDRGRPAILSIVPTHGGDGVQTGLVEEIGVAILYVMAAARSLANRVEPVCQLHAMSRVETEIVALLTEGMTLSEAAAKRHIKLDTARTYLKTIFLKTGIHRQSDLIAMVGRYAQVIRGNITFRSL